MAAALAFYHVVGETPAMADAVLPLLLEKALSTGAHIHVVAPTPERAKRLDESLWTYDPASFLPHGLAEDNAAAPITVHGVQQTLPDVNQSIVLVLAGAEHALPTVLPAAQRVLYVFDSHVNRLENARAEWKKLKANGANLTYWQQTDKGWQKKQ
jgi:DNA polymerase III subunit chi